MVPSEVQTSFRLWRASVVAAVAASTLSIPIVEDLLRLRGQELPGDVEPALGVEQLAAGAVGGAVLAAGFGALLLVVAVRMREGRSWARTALAVVGAVAVLVGLLTVGETFALFGVGPLGAVVALLRLATIGLVAAATSSMFRPGAAAWFAARTP